MARKSRSYHVHFTDPATDRDLYAVFTNVTQATRDYFSRSFGNWLPGDPAEADFSHVEDEDGVEVAYEPTERELNNWTDEAIAQAAEVARNDYEDAMERRADAARDDRMFGRNG